MKWKLAEVLNRWRWAKEFTVRRAAREIGISSATFSRIENGEMPDGRTLQKILIWLLKES